VSNAAVVRERRHENEVVLADLCLLSCIKINFTLAWSHEYERCRDLRAIDYFEDLVGLRSAEITA